MLKIISLLIAIPFTLMPLNMPLEFPRQTPIIHVGNNIFKTTAGEDNEKVYVLPDNKLVFTRWGGENYLQIDFSSWTKVKSVDINGTLVWNDKDRGFYFQKFDRDNIKFGVILNKKPQSNKFKFKLQGYQDFDFWYQGQDTNVPGSYAVYHKTKRDYIIGQTNYVSGKAWHIYRPKFYDATGKCVDGNISIDGNDYIVTAPQDFLNTATYPVRANDTLGTSAIGASNQGWSRVSAWNYSASSAGTCSAISSAVYWGGTNHTEMGIYTNNAGSPSTLVANSDTGSLVVAHGDKPTQVSEFTTATITAEISITDYWLAMSNDNADIQIACDASGTHTMKRDDSNFDGSLPATFTVNGDFTQTNVPAITLYATYGTPPTALSQVIICMEEE